MSDPELLLIGKGHYSIAVKEDDIIEKINKTDSILDADLLDSELRIFDWIFYQVCKDQQKKLGISIALLRKSCS